jgi:hypothetical protein
MFDIMTRRRLTLCCAVAPIAALVACATTKATASLPAGAVAALAPSGRLRACINLGNPILANRDAAGVVSGVSVAASISAGAEHSCASLANGTAKCWGYNSFGQLGNGTATSSSDPVVVSGLAGAVMIAAGGSQSCALSAAGTMK